MGHLSNFSQAVSRTTRLAVKKLKHLIRLSVKGIFPPIAIISALALVIAIVGVPNLGARPQSLPYYIFLGIGLIFGILLWKVPRRRYNAIFASVFGWLPVFLGALSYIFWYRYAIGYEIGGEFFHAAADVLPVILLATVIDVRRTNDLEGKQLVLPIAVVFLGELAALDALAFPGDVTPAFFAVVASSLVTATIALVLAVMADVASSAGDERKEIEEPSPSAKVAEDESGPAQVEASRGTIEEFPQSCPHESPTVRQEGGVVRNEPGSD